MDDIVKEEISQEETPKKKVKRGGHRQRAPKRKVPNKVSELANTILKDEPDVPMGDGSDWDTEEQQVVEKVELGEEEAKSVAPPFQKTQSRQAVEVEKKPVPIKLEHGFDPFTSYIIQRTETEIYSLLESIFGRGDGDFFILSDNIFTRIIEGQPQRFKVSMVEDKHGFRYNIWFNISRLSLV